MCNPTLIFSAARTAFSIVQANQEAKANGSFQNNYQTWLELNLQFYKRKQDANAEWHVQKQIITCVPGICDRSYKIPGAIDRHRNSYYVLYRVLYRV